MQNNLNFKKLIKSNLICSKSSDIQLNNTKKTLDLTKYDNIDSFFIKDNIDLSRMEIDDRKYTKRESVNNISLSKIMDDLSSNYSIYISNNCNNKNDEDKNKIINNIIKNKKKEGNKKDKNIILSDKILLSFTNLYKNRNKVFPKKPKKKNYATNNNSITKFKKSLINEIIKEKIIKSKMKNRFNLPLNEIKNSNVKKKFKLQNDLKIAINTFTRNKGLKEKKEKDNNNNKHTLTATNTWINVTSYNNSTNNSLSRLKIRKQKMKKLYLRNLKIITPSYKYKGPKMSTPTSNTIESNDNNNINNSKNKYNLTRLLSHKDGKYKNYLINGNIINLKNFNSYRYIKRNQNNNDPFTKKINRLIKEKKIITSTNSFSNKKNNNNNTKNDKKSTKKVNSTINKQNNYTILNKKKSNKHLIRNLVLTQFHSKKEIIYNSKKNYNNSNNNSCNVHHKLIPNITKRTSTGKTNKNLNDSLIIKPYKKELNKINLNFNFNINFNIDVNKNRQKRFLNSYKNNLGFLTQRNQIIKGNIINKKSKNKNGYGEMTNKKNTISNLVKKMKNEYNLNLKKNIKQLK